MRQLGDKGKGEGNKREIWETPGPQLLRISDLNLSEVGDLMEH